MLVHRASISGALILALAASAPVVACRAIDGLEGVTFDPGLGGGATSCACGEPLPQGWSGPIAVYEGPPDDAPGCPEEYPIPVLDGGLGLSAAAATCSPCSCDAPQVTCKPGAVGASSHSGCNGNKQTLTPVPGVCTPFSPSGDYFFQSPSQASVACSPAGGAASLVPHVWTKAAVACGLAQGSGRTCSPPPAPFEARTCVWRTGAEACPAQFPVARGWASAVDTRDCAPCTCSAPSPAPTCTVTTELFSDTQCQKYLSDVGPAGQCGLQWGVNSVLATVVISGSSDCTPGGGTPVGAASAHQALTVCCAP